LIGWSHKAVKPLSWVYIQPLTEGQSRGFDELLPVIQITRLQTDLIKILFTEVHLELIQEKLAILDCFFPEIIVWNTINSSTTFEMFMAYVHNWL